MRPITFAPRVQIEREGILRGAQKVGDRYFDMLIFSKLAQS